MGQRKMTEMPQGLYDFIDHQSDEDLGRAFKEYVRENQKKISWEGFSPYTLAGFCVVLQDFQLAYVHGLDPKLKV
jgi:hypothetical protein